MEVDKPCPKSQEAYQDKKLQGFKSCLVRIVIDSDISQEIFVLKESLVVLGSGSDNSLEQDNGWAKGEIPPRLTCIHVILSQWPLSNTDSILIFLSQYKSSMFCLQHVLSSGVALVKA